MTSIPRPLLPIAATLALVAGTAHAAGPAQSNPAKPKVAAGKTIAGMWALTKTEYDRHEAMPLTPKALALQETARKAREEGGAVLSASGRKCLPIGMPTFMTNEFALEVLTAPDRVTLLSENSSLPRSVYLDEAKHPGDIEASWNGHSIGHWEGRVLVVDTVGFNDRVGPVGNAGVHSPTTHLTERLYLKDPDTLVDEMTFEDPTYLTRPWVNVHSYRRLPPHSELWEYACEVDAPGWSERYAGDPEAKLPK
jgi:hypothetical protein